MDMFRIEGEWIKGGSGAEKQTVELVAGFTDHGYIASGNWFGMVKDYDTVHPFVLTDDGYCRYAGNRSQTRYFSIVSRPVKVGEIFELTWEDAKDLHHYQIIKVARLNVLAEAPDAEPLPASSTAASEGNNIRQPEIFIKTTLVERTGRPEAFKATVESLIQSGNVVATGKNGIEHVFATNGRFSHWFDTVRPPKAD